MKFLDAHLHLQDKRFQGMAQELIAAAGTAGVARQICCATSEKDWGQVVELAARHSEVLPMLGVHPWWAHKVQPGWRERYLEMLTMTGAGVGEIGLCSLVEPDPSAQEKVFAAQLAVAAELNRPVAVHCVRRWGRMLEVLADFYPQEAGLMIHAFGASPEIMDRLLALGAMLSFSGRLADPRNEKMRRLFQEAPLERILLESDAPDMYCGPLVGDTSGKKSNSEPVMTAKLYRFAADLKNMDLERFAAQVWENGQIFTH
ncbi:MAG: TatD family hydrolase [Proteobacteria bacterium]|nr:TatD family hydrolase [Pseudomonadota bacterium]MBU1687237.1 TatD family hydrolase [Pseudomonadota bacterium]